MLRLSQRAWNNVIIFTTLVMILLFTSTTKILNGDAPEAGAEPSLLPAQSTILTIDYGQQKIERIGRGWRLKPGHNVEESDLQVLTDNWLLTSLQPVDVQVSAQPLIVVVWLAGESQGIEYQFFPLEEGLLVRFAQQLYQIQHRSLADLFPPGGY